MALLPPRLQGGHRASWHTGLSLQTGQKRVLERPPLPTQCYVWLMVSRWSALHGSDPAPWCVCVLVCMCVSVRACLYVLPPSLTEVPAFASKPHFLDGDPSLLRDVKGLHPDPAKHDIVVDIEPVSVVQPLHWIRDSLRRPQASNIDNALTPCTWSASSIPQYTPVYPSIPQYTLVYPSIP